jgi:hypothetical protein
MLFGSLFIGKTCGRNYAFTHASFVFHFHSLLSIADGSEVGYVKDERLLVFIAMRTSHLTFWTFMGMCIVMYFYIKTNQMHNF